MCGICGASGPEAGRLVAAMNKLQRHRGPDNASIAPAAGFVLGNTRLAIIDLSDSGNQPLASRDGTVVCVFNGEIYNHRELVRDHRLDTTSASDGAVIPALYRKYGISGLGLLRGMFAVALVDIDRRRLVLARDPLGIKPLHWCRGPEGEVLFASEPRALAAALGSATPSQQALVDFLRNGSVASGLSPLAGIDSLAPNEWLELDTDAVLASGAVREPQWRYGRWDGDDLRDALLDSVRLHLRSDVPTALLLSSGVDSAAVAWAAAQCAGPLTCFTVDVGGGRPEGEAASEVARRYGHRHVVVSRQLEHNDARSFIRAMQRPSIDGLNTYLVCRVVAEHDFKVALSGIGGDEALAGYRHFRLLPYLHALRWSDRVPRALREALVARLPRRGALASDKVLELIGSDGPRNAPGLSRLQRRLFSPADVRALAGVEVAVEDMADDNGSGGAGRNALDLSVAEIEGYLQGTLLPDADTYSMTWSVELRVPLVDVEFLRVALAVDPVRGVGKREFARIVGDPLLQECAARPKQGFELPMDRWLRDGPLSPFLGALDDPAAPLWQHVDKDAGQAVLARWRRGGRWSEAWALAALNAWLADLAGNNTAPPGRERSATCAD
jgi:asparagine synthase (glutamine-hydrolysing)